MSVRVRLTLWNVSFFALALVLLGVLLRTQTEGNLMGALDRQLATANRFLPSDGILRTFSPERWRIRRLASNFTPPFYDTEGRNLYVNQVAGDPEAILAACLTGRKIHSTQNGFRYYTVPLVAAESGQWVAFQGSESLAPIHAEVNRLTRQLLTLIPLALAIAAAGGMFLTGRALAPVRQATDAASRIGAEDLSERLPIRGRDEFAALATTFNGMLERLDAAFERQKRFVADASHELKTPLTVIKANTSLALADPELSDDYRETLVEIDRAADRTSRIVQDLLLLAKSDHGQLPLRSDEIPMARLCADALQEARRLHPEGAPVTVTAEGTLLGDPHLLHRLLVNLLDNALRHTPSDGAVALDADPSGFTVTDTGEGIAPEHLVHLGERFYRVDSARARQGGGTGLGLAISQAITAAHGGSLQIESTVGKGTRVHVRLGHA